MKHYFAIVDAHAAREYSAINKLPRTDFPKLYPPDYGLGVAGLYAVSIFVILLLYPLCRWFAALNADVRCG